MRQVLETVGRQPFASRFYLAGGTALALQFGQKFPIEVDEGGLASLLINIQGSYAGFFGYSYPLLAPTYTLAGIRLAGMLDIGFLSKWSRARRPSKIRSALSICA